MHTLVLCFIIGAKNSPTIAHCSYRGGHASIRPKLVILLIFWAKWDWLDINRCQNPPQKFF